MPDPAPRRPNIIVLFADQMRAEATGYTGNADVQTPHLDRMAAEGVTFTTGVANCPVCTPYRASLLTGRYPLSTGMFLNDLRLPEEELTIAQVLRETGYDTAYIGKWHLDGPERSGFTPPGPRRQGFDFWAVGNCTHRYSHSLYYLNDDPTPRHWEGYDALAQADLACDYVRARRGGAPYCLFLSWGPPHNPYRDVQDEYLRRYEPDTLRMRPSYEDRGQLARDRCDLAGYYAHITALDEALGRILRTLEETGQAEDTILVFTSDHGDMLGAHGRYRKQWPWDESILVPLIVRFPRAQGDARRVDSPMNVVDLMPTILSLAGLAVPDTVEGTNLSHLVRGEAGDAPESALIEILAPFAEMWPGVEWRGVRTARYTYVRLLDRPWLLFDNLEDPGQTRNLVGDAGPAAVQRELEDQLRYWLARTRDRFLPAAAHIAEWGYKVNARGEIPYRM